MAWKGFSKLQTYINKIDHTLGLMIGINDNHLKIIVLCFSTSHSVWCLWW